VTDAIFSLGSRKLKDKKLKGKERSGPPQLEVPIWYFKSESSLLDRSGGIVFVL